MNKKLTQKLVAAMAVAIFSVAGLMAQVANSDYVRYDANTSTPTNVDFVTLNTGGTDMGYYAEPDPVYHPAYTGPAWTLTAGFTWAWTVPTDPGTPAVVTYPVAAAPANYVEINFPVAGNYIVNVAETASAGFGGCVGTTTVMNVTVINPPTASVTTADPAQACGDQAATSFTVRINENLNDSIASYAFKVIQDIDNIASDDSFISNDDSSTYVDFATTTKVNSTTTTAQMPAVWTTTGSDRDLVFNTAALTVRNNQRTRYTYTLYKATDAPGAAAEGIISAISEKSDYVNGTVRTHAFGADVAFVAIVNPQPQTGPIFHIPNQYAF